MTFSRTAPRHDLTYLRRRPKPGEGAPTPPPATERSSGPSLDLSGTSDRQPQKAAPAPSATSTVRRARGRAMLSRDAPAVTLDRRQSAIGSLVWELVGGGQLSCAWELVDGEAGLVSASTGVEVSPEFGRRSIVGRHARRRIIIGLRHVRELRRILLIGKGLPVRPPSRLIGDLHDGSTIESAHGGGVDPVFALVAGYQVDGELHFRGEHESFGSEEKAAAAYGFALTWLPPIRR